MGRAEWERLAIDRVDFGFCYDGVDLRRPVGPPVDGDEKVRGEHRQTEIFRSPAETVRHQERNCRLLAERARRRCCRFCFFKPLGARKGVIPVFGYHARGTFSSHGSARGRKFTELLWEAITVLTKQHPSPPEASNRHDVWEGSLMC